MRLSRAGRFRARLPVSFVYGLFMKPFEARVFGGGQAPFSQGDRARLKTATMEPEKQRVNTLATISNDTLTRR